MSAMQIQRQSVEYTPTYQRFVLKQKSYAKQFSHVYVKRLLRLRAAVGEQVARSGCRAAVLPKIIDLRAGDECVIIGTTLKVLAGKPDLFDALLREDGVAPIERLGRPLAGAGDQLVLEDESGRVQLAGAVSVARLATGVVLGARGAMDAAANAFVVAELFWPAPAPQRALPERAESAFVALVSGLALGAPAADARAHVLVDYLAGRLGDERERAFVARIVRTVVAGNSVADPMGGGSGTDSTSGGDDSTSASSRKSVEQLALEAEPVRRLDELLASLASAMSVDVMPGAHDPSNYALPQQSLHACLLPRGARFASLRAVTNPYEAAVGGVALFGHAGQPLDSLLQCTLADDDGGDAEKEEEEDGDARERREAERALDCLESSLRWRHAAPTAPDLVACFPLAHDDPFVLDATPHVFFAGNQKRFATRLVTDAADQQVRLICVPSFAETSTIVLVDLKDLSCFPIVVDV